MDRAPRAHGSRRVPSCCSLRPRGCSRSSPTTSSGTWPPDAGSSEHGRVPRADPFRFTSHGAPWVDHEWLFQVLLYGARAADRTAGAVRTDRPRRPDHRAFGGGRRAGRDPPRRRPPRWSAPRLDVLAVLAAVLGARPRLFLRPELVTLLCLALLLLLLQEIRRARGRRRLVLAATAVLLAVPWANAHPGALAAPIVAGAFLVGSRLPGGEAGRRGGSAPIPWPVVVALAGPAGARPRRHPQRLGDLRRPGRDRLLAPRPGGGQPGVAPALEPGRSPATPSTCSPPSPRSRCWPLSPSAASGRLDPATGLAAGALATLAATSIRHQALFYVGAVVFAGECLADLWRVLRPEPSGRAVRPRRVAILAAVLCLLAAAWVLVPPPGGPLAPPAGPLLPGLRPPAPPLPGPPGRPGRGLAGKVGCRTGRTGGASLGRFTTTSPGAATCSGASTRRAGSSSTGATRSIPELLRELAVARRSSPAWDALLARYGVDGAVVRYDERRLQVLDPPERPGGEPVASRHTPHAVFFPRETFALVAWDDIGMLLVRRTPERARRCWPPRSTGPSTRRTGSGCSSAPPTDPGFRAAALAEVERRLDEGPPCARAERAPRSAPRPGASGRRLSSPGADPAPSGRCRRSLRAGAWRTPGPPPRARTPSSASPRSTRGGCSYERRKPAPGRAMPRKIRSAPADE